jgi:hypothetical protein
VHFRLLNDLTTRQLMRFGLACLQYGPQTQKTFTGALEVFFVTKFPQLAGDRARRSVVQGIVEMMHRIFPATSNLRQGQTIWIRVAKDEMASYGKTIPKTRMEPARRHPGRPSSA